MQAVGALQSIGRHPIQEALAYTHNSGHTHEHRTCSSRMSSDTRSIRSSCMLRFTTAGVSSVSSSTLPSLLLSLPAARAQGWRAKEVGKLAPMRWRVGGS